MRQAITRLLPITILLPLALWADPLPEEIFIAQGQEDVRIRGGNELGRLGQALFVRGDIDGDGYMDMLIGAPQANGAIGPGSGKTYLFFGSQSLPDTIDLLVSPADVTISGMVANEWSGYSLASGDFNDDGFDDIAIGALYSGTDVFFHAGRIYVIFGASTLPSIIDLAVDSADVIISGGGADFRLGAAVAAGDINGDGKDDLVAAAPQADFPNGANGGEVYVFLGAASWAPRIDLAESAADVTIQAEHADDHLGTALAVGDVNGDSYDEILMGAPDADPQGRSAAGSAYILYGTNVFPDSIPLSEGQADVIIMGGWAGIRLGWSVAIGDFDARGIGEIVLGAPYMDTGGGSAAGEVYVIEGSYALEPSYDLASVVADVRVEGAHAQDNAGAALAMGDVDGDGYDDLLIGAYNADVGAETEAGICYLIYGRSLVFPLVLDLGAGAADVTTYGSFDNDFLGRALGIMDVNGDGYGDMVIGASGADSPGGASAGETYVIYGDGVSSNFWSYRRSPPGPQPRVRFYPQDAWVKFVNGTLGLLQVSRSPSQPPNAPEHAADVWWRVSSSKQNTTNIQLMLRYTDEQIAGLDESLLTLWRRLETVEGFAEIPDATVDPETNRIRVVVNYLGQFAIGDLLHPLGVSQSHQTPGVPDDYYLYAAVPNPFNATVALTYELPARGNVRLAVFNVLGQEVATVVDEAQMPGRYRFLWDPGSASSGIYFAVLKVNEFEGVQKLLLLR